MDGLQELAVRYKFHRMMPLGIGDEDFPRLAGLIGISEHEIRKAHEVFARTNDAAARKLPQIDFRPGRRVSICFVGDSLTAESMSYAKIIKAAMSQISEISFRECAVPGWKTSDAVFELQDRILSEKSEIVHLMLGTNDAKNDEPGRDCSTVSITEYGRNMKRLVEACKKSGAYVIVSTIPPVKKITATEKAAPVWITEDLNCELREVCKTRDVVLNDTEKDLKLCLEDIIDSFDNVHLNPKGQLLLAERIYPFLEEAIKKC